MVISPPNSYKMVRRAAREAMRKSAAIIAITYSAERRKFKGKGNGGKRSGTRRRKRDIA